MNRSTKTMSRTQLLAIGTFVIMAAFVLRLFYLQVIQYNYFAAMSDKEQSRQWKLPAVRGSIYAMNGDAPVQLAMNETRYTVWADPKVVEEPEKVIEVLKKVAGGTVRGNIAELLAKKETRYQIVATKVSYKQAEMIKKEKLYGIGFERTEQRVYPEGRLGSQILGFVNDDGNGQYGIEGALDSRLKGTDGLIKTVADVRDVPLTIGKENINIPAKNGDDIVLTIDRNIQHQAERVLQDNMKKIGAKSGSMLVMNPRNGKIFAMANLPSYDPANLATITDLSVLNNNIISRPYEPASVIKTLTMSTAVDKGVMTPDSKFNNTDFVKIYDRTITNASKGQTGVISMQHVLNWSLNTGTVEVAKWLGGGEINQAARDTMYSYFHDKFGLGKKTGIELVGEAEGTVVPPNTVEGNAVRYANMTFGQGLNVTPLQVASAFSSIVNGGTYYQPSIIEGTLDAAGKVNEASAKNGTQILKKSTSDTMRDMIHKARQSFFADGDRSGYMIGGKTGTAQTIENGKYVLEQTEGTYLGFGGEKGKAPNYVILVTYAAPKRAITGDDAIPSFTQMSNWLIDYFKLQPKGR